MDANLVAKYREKISPSAERARAWSKTGGRILGERIANVLYTIFKYGLLICLCYVVLQPIMLAFLRSLATREEVAANSFVWIPNIFTFQNYKRMFDTFPRYKDYVQLTATVALGSTALTLITCSLTGYGLARYKFKGSNIVFALAIFTFIVPVQTAYLPLYLSYNQFDFFFIGRLIGLFTGEPFTKNLLFTYSVYYLPAILGVGINSGLIIFLFTQYFKGFPSELEEAARVDGCGRFRIFIRIFIPNALPVYVTAALLSLVWYWNDENVSKILYNAPDRTTIMNFLQRNDISKIAGATSFEEIDKALVMASATFLAVIPLMLLFFVCQKFLIECIDRTSIKG